MRGRARPYYPCTVPREYGCEEAIRIRQVNGKLESRYKRRTCVLVLALPKFVPAGFSEMPLLWHGERLE